MNAFRQKPTLFASCFGLALTMLTLSVPTALAGYLQDAGGAISQAGKDAGGTISQGSKDLGGAASQASSAIVNTISNGAAGVTETAQRAYYHAVDLTEDEWNQFTDVLVKDSDLSKAISALEGTLSAAKQALAQAPQVHAPAYLSGLGNRLTQGVSPQNILQNGVSVLTVANLTIPTPQQVFGNAPNADWIQALVSATVAPITAVTAAIPTATKAAVGSIGSLGASAQDIGSLAGEFGEGTSAIIMNLGTGAHNAVSSLFGLLHHAGGVILSWQPHCNCGGENMTFPDEITPWALGSVCLSRATKRATDYRTAISQLQLANWPQSHTNVSLSDIAKAARVLDQQILQLSAGLVEVTQNNCDTLGVDNTGSGGIAKPLKDALTDAQEWRDWVVALRREKI